jgi:hypothetical protein
MSTAEFGLVSDNPANVILGFTPNAAGGWLNAGSATNLLLAVSGCPCGPVLAGTILTLVNQPGSLCIGGTCGAEATFDCSPPPLPHGMDWVGLDFGAGICARGGLCSIGTPLEVESWGKVKAMYR